MTCPEVKAIYEETIRELTFRNSDAITIPKNVRENAYTLAIDIVIISTAREVYKNYGVSPAEGFYGNATLVMHDMCEIKIPVKMPKQRLYYGRVDEAFLFWQSLVDWTYFQAYFSALGKDLIPIGNALGISYAPAPFCCSLPDRSWIELPLREVYFNCPNGTQYKIEISWYKALQIMDGCGNIRDPSSKMADGDKDSGLPLDGVQPNVASDRNNPFLNLPTPSTYEEQGGFANPKINGLDNVGSDNFPPGFGYFAKLVVVQRFPSVQNCRLVETTYYYLVNSADVLSVVATGAVENRCNQTFIVYNVTGSVSGTIDTGFTSQNGVVATIIRSANLPATEVRFLE